MTARAQEPDGYLNTYFTLTCPDRKFANLLEGCELYCAGHLMEGAAALYEATGNRKLLDVMCKTADLFYRHFITQGAEGYPGHPEVELGLIRLWPAAGEPRSRQLAEHFVNVRGLDPEFYIDGYREEPRTLKLIPYFLWGNRGLPPMRIWLPVR